MQCFTLKPIFHTVQCKNTFAVTLEGSQENTIIIINILQWERMLEDLISQSTVCDKRDWDIEGH